MDTYFESNGDTLFARIVGSGEPIILHPGLGGSNENTFEFLGGLSGEYQLIAPDLRGAGQSECRKPDRYTWEQYADDVIALMDSLSLTQATIGGVSFGAAVSLSAALRYPKRFNALILLSPAHMGNFVGYLPSQLPRIREIETDGRMLLETDLESVLRAKDSTVREQLEKRWGRYDMISLATFMSSYAQMGHPFGSLGELESLKIPTLVLPGDDDIHHNSVGNAYASSLPNVSVIDREKSNKHKADSDGNNKYLESEIRHFLERIHQETEF